MMTFPRLRSLARRLDVSTVNAAAAIALMAVVLPAQTTINITCNRDNTLYEAVNGDLSNGQGNGVFVGVTGSGSIRRSLLHFDVAAQVPAGARIISATLTVNITRSSSPTVVLVEGHRVESDWGEGTSIALGGGGGGTLATTLDATWLNTFYPGAFWNNVGGDFSHTTSFTMSMPGSGLVSSQPSAEMLADVQLWLDNPALNFGWLLKSNEVGSAAARRFDSRDNAFGIAPKLQVTYLTPGQSAAVGIGCPVSGVPFTLALSGAPIGGTTPQLVQSHGPVNQLAVNLMALEFDPVGTPLLPQCSLNLPFGGLIATLNILTLDGVGAGSTPLPLAAGFTGLTLVSQSAAFDGTPNGYVLSNAVVMLLQ